MKIQIKGITGGRDRRRIIKKSYKFLFTECTEDEALEADLPIVQALPEVDRQITEWLDNSSFMITASFEGILSEPTPDQDQFRVKGEWRQEPIEVFPFRKELEDKYGAYEEDGKLLFPEFLSSKAQGGTGIGAGSDPETNPLFGVHDYPVQLLVASHSFVRRSVPSSVYTDVGRIVKALPAGFDNPPKRTWLIDPPDVQKKGNAWTIVRNWKEIGDLKHIEALQLLLSAKRKS